MDASRYALALQIILDTGVVSIASGQTQLQGAPPIDVLSISSSGSSVRAFGDAIWGLTSCSVTASASGASAAGTVTCVLPTSGFAPVIGQTTLVIVDDAGADPVTSSRIPYVGTAINVSSSGSTVTLSTGIPGPAYSSRTTHLLEHVANFDFPIASSPVSNNGSLYTFGSMQTLVCTGAACDAHDTPATGRPGIMLATGAAPGIANAGSGGMVGGASSGSCTLSSLTQSSVGGSLTFVAGTITAGTLSLAGLVYNARGAISGDGALSSGGTYTEAFSSSGTNSAGQLCSFSTNPTLTLTYGIVLEQINPGTGLYLNDPPCKAGAAALSSSDSGTAAMVSCSQGGDIFSGTVSFGTDNTSIFQTYALGAYNGTIGGTMNDQAAHGQPRCIYIPAGNYLTRPINSSPSPASYGTSPGYAGTYTAHGYGCWLGDEHYHSNLFMVPNVAGDMFAWVGANYKGSLPSLGNTQLFAGGPNMAGSGLRHITVIGNRLSTVRQNGAVFYGTTEFANIEDFTVNYVNGSPLQVGMPDATGSGSMKESVLDNARFEFSGSNMPGASFVAPTIDIGATSVGGTPAQEGSNNLSLVDVRIYQSLGPGIWIHNHLGVGNNTRGLRIANLKEEGSEVSLTTEGGDLLEIGDTDPTISSASVSDVLCRNADFVNPVLRYAAVHIAGTSGHEPSIIDCEGAITGPTTSGGFGRGTEIDSCQQCSLKEANNNSGDSKIVVGIPGPGNTCNVTSATGFSLQYNGIGAEQSSATITGCIDPAVGNLNLVNVPTVHPAH